MMESESCPTPRTGSCSKPWLLSHRLMSCPPNPLCPEYLYKFVSLFFRCWVYCLWRLEWDPGICIFSPRVQERETETRPCVIDPPWIWKKIWKTLQATQPLFLCNLYISSRNPKAAHIHSSRHLNLKARASVTMPAVLDDMEPQQWSESLPWVLKTVGIQHKETSSLWARKKELLSLSAAAVRMYIMLM